MLYVSFLWHMHQPWYLNPETNTFILPWVRLHGTKDYLDMACLLQEFPKIHSVINVAPCLLEQIELYEKGVKDDPQILCEKPAESLTDAQQDELLRISFYGNPDRLVHPYPRYYELMAKAQRKQKFSIQECRDLQVWSNLVWMDPRWRREFPEIGSMVTKEAQFSEEEKQRLFQIQRNLLKKIIPTYRTLQEHGQIELSTTPWAHPILPLLFNTEVSHLTNPGMASPAEAFRFPEDATWHLKEAVSCYNRWFGKLPQGLWPSEGSVSESIVPLVAQAGFRWMATDEEILWKSLSLKRRNPSRELLYQPYKIGAGERSIKILFRDHLLSDLIGFVYNKWEAKVAASDFVNRLKAIEQATSSQSPPPLILIALDGENAWEFYPDDGEPFLRALYETLSQESSIRCYTVSEYLNEYPNQEALESLAPGSWIRGELSTWIGHEAQNQAWEELGRIRRIIGPSESRSVAVAEGSDWFWWFGPEHSSAQDAVFDRLFRAHLKSAYQTAGQVPPSRLEEPFKQFQEDSFLFVCAPMGTITPHIDGEVTSYLEWLRAGEVELRQKSSSMARAQPVLSRIRWGSNASHLYFRLDPVGTFKDSTFQLFLEEDRFRVSLSLQNGILDRNSILCESTKSEKNAGSLGEDVPVRVGVGKIIEMALPLDKIGLTPGEWMKITVAIQHEGVILEQYPEKGFFSMILPDLAGPSEWWSA